MRPFDYRTARSFGNVIDADRFRMNGVDALMGFDADANAFFMPDGKGSRRLVTLEEFGTPAGGAGYIGLDKNGFGREFADGEVPRHWDGFRWRFETHGAATRMNALLTSAWTENSATKGALTGGFGAFESQVWTSAAAGNFATTTGVSITSGSVYTVAARFRKDPGSTGIVDFYFIDSAAQLMSLRVNVADGTFSAFNVSAGWTNTSYTITVEGSGWVQVVFTGTCGNSGSAFLRLFPDRSGGSQNVAVGAIQLTETHYFPGWIGGDKTVGSVARAALDWLGSATALGHMADMYAEGYSWAWDYTLEEARTTVATYVGGYGVASGGAVSYVAASDTNNAMAVFQRNASGSAVFFRLPENPATVGRKLVAVGLGQDSFNAAFNGAAGSEDTTGDFDTPGAPGLSLGQTLTSGGALSGGISRFAVWPDKFTGAELETWA